MAGRPQPPWLRQRRPDFRRGALRLSVTETLLIFVGIPAAIVLVITALSLAGGGHGGRKRYRPGRPFEFTPVWFLSRPEHLGESARSALAAGAPVRALTGGDTEIAVTRQRAGATGGASDHW